MRYEWLGLGEIGVRFEGKGILNNSVFAVICLRRKLLHLMFLVLKRVLKRHVGIVFMFIVYDMKINGKNFMFFSSFFERLQIDSIYSLIIDYADLDIFGIENKRTNNNKK